MEMIKDFNSFYQWLDNVKPKIGDMGGRFFVDAQGKQHRLNEIVAHFRKIHPTERKKRLSNRILKKIIHLNREANTLLNQKSIFIRITTAIRQFFGNLFYDKKKEFEVIKDFDAPPTADERIEKNRRIAQEQGENEHDKGFRLNMTLPANGKVLGQPLCTKVKEIHGKEIGMASCQGGRAEMEDQDLATTLTFFTNHQKFTAELYGVFDGHAGKRAAIFVKENLPHCLAEALENKPHLDHQTITCAFKESFKRLDEAFARLYGPREISGTTAVVAMILNDELWIANVGDSRAIIDKEGKMIQLSEDAVPTIQRYREKIERAGGELMQDRFDPDTVRINGELAVARAIGDKNLGKAVSAAPKVTCYPLNEIQSSYLVIACDGLYDVASSKQVVSAVETLKESGKTAKEMAPILVYSAIASNSYDNVSVLILKIE